MAAFSLFSCERAAFLAGPPAEYTPLAAGRHSACEPTPLPLPISHTCGRRSLSGWQGGGGDLEEVLEGLLEQERPLGGVDAHFVGHLQAGRSGGHAQQSAAGGPLDGHAQVRAEAAHLLQTRTIPNLLTTPEEDGRMGVGGGSRRLGELQRRRGGPHHVPGQVAESRQAQH